MRFYQIIICIASFVYFLVIEDYLLITSFGLFLGVFFSILFIEKLGKSYPIRELILLISISQWIVGAKLSYNYGKMHYKYYMYVDEETYMSYVVPAIFFFIIGIYSIKLPLALSKIKSEFKINRIDRLRYHANILILIGILSPIVNQTLGIGSIAFILYLCSLLLFVGASYYAFILPKRKVLIFGVTLGFIFIRALTQGMFHSFLLVGVFLLFILFVEKDSFFKKTAILIPGLALIYAIQVIKHDYRSYVWGQGSDNYIEIFSNLIQEEFILADNNNTSYAADLGAEKESQKVRAGANVRLNQGWIISKVLQNVPKNVDFVKGQTIMETVKASFLPRFLFPNKPGSELALKNFEKLSGISLGKNTSMGLSVVAEFYANYGVVGGWIAMFVYGLFLAFSIRFIIKILGNNSSVMVLWFILFFFQVVKAETDLIKIVNHLAKSIILFVILDIIFKAFGINLFPRNTNELEE